MVRRSTFRHGRKDKVRFSRAPGLRGSPQKRGICTKFFIRTPRKPNSAKRKVASVGLSNRQQIVAYIPGGEHNLQKFAVVLVRGGRTRDLPGLKYKLRRGSRDLFSVLNRRHSRSKYGTKRTLGRIIVRTAGRLPRLLPAAFRWRRLFPFVAHQSIRLGLQVHPPFNA